MEMQLLHRFLHPGASLNSKAEGGLDILITTDVLFHLIETFAGFDELIDLFV